MQPAAPAVLDPLVAVRLPNGITIKNNKPLNGEICMIVQ